MYLSIMDYKLAGVFFYLSEASSPPMTTYPPGAKTFFRYNQRTEAIRDAVFIPKKKHDIANKMQKVWRP